MTEKSKMSILQKVTQFDEKCELFKITKIIQAIWKNVLWQYIPAKLANSGGKGGKLGSVRFLFRFVDNSCNASLVLGNLHRLKTAGKLYSLIHVALLRCALAEVRPKTDQK